MRYQFLELNWCSHVAEAARRGETAGAVHGSRVDRVTVTTVYYSIHLTLIRDTTDVALGYVSNRLCFKRAINSMAYMSRVDSIVVFIAILDFI